MVDEAGFGIKSKNPDEIEIYVVEVMYGIMSYLQSTDLNFAENKTFIISRTKRRKQIIVKSNYPHRIIIKIHQRVWRILGKILHSVMYSRQLFISRFVNPDFWMQHQWGHWRSKCWNVSKDSKLPINTANDIVGSMRCWRGWSYLIG